MNNNSTNAMKQPEFVFTAKQVCFVREVTPLTPQIDISRVRTDEFCIPVYAAISDDDIRLTDEYIAELQAQGVDKLADAIRDIHNGLTDNGYDNDIIAALLSEIRRCRTFASRLRNLKTLLDRKLPGGMVYLSEIRAAVSNSQGEVDNSVLSPLTDIVAGENEIFVTGDITWR